MARVHGEVEFEFHEDGDGGGEFMACGKVISFLRNHLAKGQLDEAASLLASCGENIGDELIENISAGGSGPKIMGALAEMFFKARDYARAARCAEQAGRPDLAAQFLEANYELGQAGEYYLKANNLTKAAELFERNLNFDRAAELFLKMRDFPRAAENLERAGQYFHAGQLYLKMSRWEKAVDVLQRVDRMAEHFVASSNLLGQVLERTGNQQAAMQSYLQVVKTRPLSPETMEVHYRLGKLCAEQGYGDQANKLLAGVLGLKPDHTAARETMGLLQSGQLGQAPPTAAAPGAAAEPLPAVGPSPTDATPQPQPLDLGERAPRDTSDRMVGVDRDFEFLRQVPLFRELALEELKYVQSLCDKIRMAPGGRLISQGQPGEALYVLARGKVAITRTADDGQEHKLVELDPGAFVGEMSLLDDSATSANVIAVDEVVAFKLPRQRFQELLGANERIQVRIYRVLISVLLQRLREANDKAASADEGDEKHCPFCAERIKRAAKKCKHCGEFIEQ